ncbi:MAG: class I SAM-dependent methyltransferase [Candidatus Omnitrophota bacterium]
MRIIIFILIQAFLFSTSAFALGISVSSFCDKNCLSPAVQLKTNNFQKFFLERSLQQNTADSFQEYIKQKIIAKGGRISFAEFMDDALYSEHGFFPKIVNIGYNNVFSSDPVKAKEKKHFNTYAESLPFAHSLAIQLIEMWELMGTPDKFSIVEMGAGTGVLAKNIISYIQEHKPQLYKSLDYVIVDISERLIEIQKETIKKKFKDTKGVPIRWESGDAFHLSKLEDIEGVFLSNEMPDNFAVHRIKKVNGRFLEVYTAFHEGNFVDKLGPLSTPELKAYVENIGVEIQEGREIPVNLNLRVWQENMAKALKRGFVITIDYGGKIEEISEEPYAVWNKETNDIEDRSEKMKYIYDNSGNCDITANVNFFDTAKWGKSAGLNVHGYTLQRDFLENLDFHKILDNLQRQDKPEPGLKSLSNDIVTNFHFKVLVQSKGLDADIPLAGFKQMDGFFMKYEQKISLILPIGPKESKFIVVTNDFNLQSEHVKRGQEGLKKYADSIRDYRTKTEIIEGTNNMREGKYVLDLKRKDFSEGFSDLRIYNDKGELIFNAKNISDYEKEAFVMTKKAFDQQYRTRFDLSDKHITNAPELFYVHPDGSLLIVPPIFLPEGVVDKKESIDQNPNFILEKSI